MTPTDLALIASFAALISAFAYVGAIPVGGAGALITLQTAGVMLAGCLLGPTRGFLAVALYLALGAIGEMGAGRGLRREGRCFLRRACKERSREASHTTESVRGRVSRVRSRISRAHDLTAWNASALGQRARPTG